MLWKIIFIPLWLLIERILLHDATALAQIVDLKDIFLEDKIVTLLRHSEILLTYPIMISFIFRSWKNSCREGDFPTESPLTAAMTNMLKELSKNGILYVFQ